MDVKVRLRINKVTGEVEQFLVEDDGPMRLPEAEHNSRHDRIAADLGNVIERNAQVIEVFPGALPVVPLPSDSVSEPASEAETERLTASPETEGRQRNN
jgi:hypothetical protein